MNRFKQKFIGEYNLQVIDISYEQFIQLLDLLFYQKNTLHFEGLKCDGEFFIALSDGTVVRPKSGIGGQMIQCHISYEKNIEDCIYSLLINHKNDIFIQHGIKRIFGEK